MDGPYTEEGDLGHTLENALNLFVQSGRYPLVTYTRFSNKMTRPYYVPDIFKSAVNRPHIDRPTAFTYHKTAYDGVGQSGSIVVKSLACDARQNQAWAAKFGLPYAGQSIGALACVVFDTLIKRRTRRCLSADEKKALLAKQQEQCAGCDDPLDCPEFDHIVPLGKGGTNETTNVQALCPQCHKAKSVAEGGNSVGYAKSRFNKDVFEKYIMSPAPPCMVYKDADVEEFPCTHDLIYKHMAVDVIGSRRNALYNAVAIPVFTPLDDIVPVSLTNLYLMKFTQTNLITRRI